MLVAPLLIAAFSLSAIGPADSADAQDRAHRILDTLPGRWHFTLGKSTGVREVRQRYSGVVEWSETFEGREVEGRGFFGYDPKEDVFFSMTVHNVPGEYGFMTGRLDSSEDTIVFTPTRAGSDQRPFKSIFRLHSAAHFSYTALVMQDGDDGWTELWVASFERRE